MIHLHLVDIHHPGDHHHQDNQNHQMVKYTEKLDWAKDRWRDMIFRIIDNHPNEDLYQEVLKVITTKYDTIKEMYEAWSNINSLMQNYPESDGNIRANLFNLTNMLKDIMNPRPRINRLDPFGPSH